MLCQLAILPPFPDVCCLTPPLTSDHITCLLSPGSILSSPWGSPKFLPHWTPLQLRVLSLLFAPAVVFSPPDIYLAYRSLTSFKSLLTTPGKITHTHTHTQASTVFETIALSGLFFSSTLMTFYNDI